MLRKPYVFILLVALSAFLVGRSIGEQSRQVVAKSPAQKKLELLLAYIDHEYVDEVNTDSIVSSTIDDILQQLDPHSVYIPAKVADEVSDNMNGDFVGIGVNFYTYKDSIAVIRTIPGGPSDLGGLEAGDRILYANGDTLYGKGYLNTYIVKKLKGALNSEVQMGVYRKKRDTFFNVTLKRSHVPIVSSEGYYMLNEQLGYIRLNRFAGSTYDEFNQALMELQIQGAQKLVLDLRGNLGGYLDEATRIADTFLEKDQLIVVVKNRNGTVEKTIATGKGRFQGKQVYVLIDEESASASEVVAGALQDNDVGIIVGRRSFGKGLVQQEYPLGDGSSVRLTTAHYYTPTGRSIQKPYRKGRYQEDFYDRYASGELRSRDSIKVSDSLKFKTPKGKVVYGGGGIIPDIFVPMGSDASLGIEQLDRYGMFDYFAFETLDKKRLLFDAFQRGDFVKEYEIPESMFVDFKMYARSQGVRMNLDAVSHQTKTRIKSALAEQMFGKNAATQIANSNDPVLRKVLSLEGNKP